MGKMIINCHKPIGFWGSPRWYSSHATVTSLLLDIGMVLERFSWSRNIFKSQLIRCRSKVFPLPAPFEPPIWGLNLPRVSAHAGVLSDRVCFAVRLEMVCCSLGTGKTACQMIPWLIIHDYTFIPGQSFKICCFELIAHQLRLSKFLREEMVVIWHYWPRGLLINKLAWAEGWKRSLRQMRARWVTSHQNLMWMWGLFMHHTASWFFGWLNHVKSQLLRVCEVYYNFCPVSSFWWFESLYTIRINKVFFLCSQWICWREVHKKGRWPKLEVSCRLGPPSCR